MVLFYWHVAKIASHFFLFRTQNKMQAAAYLRPSPLPPLSSSMMCRSPGSSLYLSFSLSAEITSIILIYYTNHLQFKDVLQLHVCLCATWLHRPTGYKKSITMIMIFINIIIISIINITTVLSLSASLTTLQYYHYHYYQVAISQHKLEA